ncbi:MAG: PEP-CTERM sorting domain-containing protein [Planctomycetota bacterium]|nr:PEP-CTERM sorting domain-containing protein [Planctomycetota bacterium]
MRLRNKVFYVYVTFAAISLAGGSYAFAVILNPPLELVNTLQLGGDDVGEIGGLAPGGSYLYTGDTLWDEHENNLAVYHCFSHADGSVVSTGSIPGTYNFGFRPAGMAWSSGYLYQTVFSKGMTGIVKYTPGDPAVVADVYQFQGTEADNRAKGLTHDGRFIWQAHYSPEVGHIYAIDPATGDRVNDLLVDPYPYGVAYDGRYFWVSHHDTSAKTSYVAKYDRFGEQLATYSLPTFMSPNAAIGDLAVSGSGLFAHVLGSNEVAHFTLPEPTGSPPSLAPGVHSASIYTAATIGYDGKVVADAQGAANYAQLPIAASVARQALGSAMDVSGLARSYYDESGIHNVVNALAYGQCHESDLQASGVLMVNKSILISPSSCGLPSGTAVWAKGTITFNGLLQALRDEGEGWPDATDLAAVFTARVVKTVLGNDVVCFDGSVSLLGQEDDNWVRAVLTGGADTLALREAAGELVITETLASLELDHIQVDFLVPAVVGENFHVSTIFSAAAHVPSMAEGLGAEVAFGIAGELGEGYSVGSDPEAYYDEYQGGPWPEWPGWSDWQEQYIPPDVPEPATVIILLTGGLFVLRRRRKNLN